MSCSCGRKGMWDHRVGISSRFNYVNSCVPLFSLYQLVLELKFLIKMPPRRTRNISDVYERIMERMKERLDQFVDQFANRMNDMMNLRRYYGVAGDDYEGAPVFDDDYEEAPVFDDDQFEEESMPVYDTDIEDVIEEEEGFFGKGGFGEEEENMEDVVVVDNDICSSMIQTTVSVVFQKP
ncbi:hypothetical protein Tco_1548130 [Tanacetum coccineum]